MTRRTSCRTLAAGVLLVAAGIGFTRTMRAGENLDFESAGQIRDMFWDSRLFDGTHGFAGAILWFHNPASKPSTVNQAAFEARIEASFDAWEGVDDGFQEEPVVPVLAFGGQTGVTDIFALDGINAVGWRAEAPGGTLAVTPCWVLTAPTTTIDDGAGNTMMPVSGGAPSPFPGPIGVTYPAGAIIDCGMRFDSLDSWSTSDLPASGAFDVQAVGTHEAGHFIGISHSTVGDFSGVNPMSATMLPFAAPGDATFRTLEEDDKASVLRTYARNRFGGPLPQTIGGRGTIALTLLMGQSCTPATGVSVVAYRTSAGTNGSGRVETFSGSQFRAGILDEPYNGSVTLNVPPLPQGESYTLYARTFEQGTGALSSQRYNYTTINGNLIDPLNQSRTFDGLATVGAIAAGEQIDLGSIGMLGCSVADPNSPVNLVAGSVTAPLSATKGGTVAVASSFSNQGSAASGPFEAGIYFSTDPVITGDDLYTGFSCQIPGLAPGGAGTCDGKAAVPGGVVPGEYYVGLLVDRQSQVLESAEHDNGVAAGNLTSVAPNPLDPIVNGSFETGNLSGWTVKELTPASNPNLPLSVHPAGVQYPADSFIAFIYVLDYFGSEPTNGQFAALHDFNGNDPATPTSGPLQFVNRRELYQDVVLPAGTTTLEFDYRAAWELFRFGSTQDRTFDLEIEPAGGGATLLDETILVAPNLTIEEDTENPTGGAGFYPPGMVDLSAFAGQSVRIKFVWNIPEPGTGFGFFQLDNVRINTAPSANTPPVVTITAPASGTTVMAGDPVALAGTATDAEDGSLSGNLSWSSDLDGVLGSGASVSTSTLSVGTHNITASVTDSGGLSDSDAISVNIAPPPNTAPTVTITAPANGSSITAGSNITFTGTAADAEDGTISGGLTWSSDRDGPIGSGASASTSALSVGTHTVTASVTDSGGLADSDSISVTVTPVAPNTAPLVTITAPGDGSTVTAGDAVTFSGTATDAEDGILTGNLSWSSSLDGILGTGASISTSTLSGGTHVVRVSVVDSGGLGGSDAITVHVDVVNRAAADFSTARGTIGSGTSFQDTWAEDDVHEVLTETQSGGNPARRRSLLEHTWAFQVAAGAQYVFTVNAFHGGTEDDFAFSYSRDNASFTPMVTVTATWDNDQGQTYVFPEDVSGTLYVRVQDTDSTQGNAQLDSLFVDYLAVKTMAAGSSMTAPAVAISAPSTGAVFTEGTTVSFVATASDSEDGDLGGSIEWTSSLDGAIGMGPSFSTSALTAGAHTITAGVADSDGLQGADSISIVVLPDTDVVLSATGYKVKGIQHTDLNWTGATTGEVTIARDGVVIGTVANPGPGGGAYTDNIGAKGSGTYGYQVCETGGGACSTTVTVTF
jgi:hypothetical protein